MLQKSKRPAAFVLSVLMCISMLASLALPAASAEKTGPYDAITATQESNGTYTPAGNVVFVNAAFGSGSFEYTYGDGEKYGDGKTYNLVSGVNAFTTMLSAITAVQQAWNDYDGYYADYTGINTIVVAPGTIGFDQFQPAATVIFNKPRDESGNIIDDPEYDQYFKYTVLGPQAGKSPVTSQTDPTVANGRGMSTATECVLAGTVWTPNNAILRLDGFAANPNFKIYGYGPSGSGNLAAIELDNLYYYANVASKKWWQFDAATINSCLEITNSYAMYASMPTTNMDGDTFTGTRLVIDNFYENATALTEIADKYSQSYQKKVRPANYANTSANLLGNGKKSALFSITNCGFNGHPGAHMFRFNFNVSTLTGFTKDSIHIDVNDNYFLNTGTYGQYSNYNGGHVAQIGMIDTLSFQDAFQIPNNALTFTFKRNTIEYTADGFIGKTGGSNFFNINTSTTTVQNWILKDNIFKSNNQIKMGIVNNNKLKWDTSSFLCLDSENHVTSFVKGYESVNDVYAGDDFSGGINEMFTLTGGKDLTIAENPIQAVVTSISNLKSYIPASVTIVPKNGCAKVAASELFKFQGDNIDFVGIYEDETLGSPVDTLSAEEADGKYMVAEYKGKTTTCRVIYEIHVATPDDYGFVDATGSYTEYDFNGNTYTLDESNRYTTFAAALAAKKKVIVLLPGTYTGSATIGYSCAVLGAMYGISPNNEDMTLNTQRAITEEADGTFTFDTNKETVASGQYTVSNTGSHVQFDGFVAKSLEIYISSTTINTEKSGRMYYVFVDNVFVYNENKHLISGLGSVSATSIGIMNAKRYDYINEVRLEVVPGKWGALISSGAQIVDINRVYVHGDSTAMIATHASAGKYVLLSPEKTGIKVTNSVFDNAGCNGNWIYPNYVDMDVSTSWGQTPQANREFFPNGFYEIFDNNKFINQPANGSEEKKYVLRLTADNGNNTKIQFTNNTVTNSYETGCIFIDLATSTGKEPLSAFDCSGNIFVNYKEPIRLGTVTTKLFNIDENYYAFIEDGKEVVKTITANPDKNVEKSDWYYLNRAMTVKSSDFVLDLSAILPENTVTGFPTWKAEGNFKCGVKSFDASAVQSGDKCTVVGVYKDAACTTPLTTNITETDFYVNLQAEDVQVVYTVNAVRANADHIWSDWSVAEGDEATCTNDGKATHTCQNCGEIEEKVIPAFGHTPGSPQLQMPTCEEDAAMVTRCVTCGEIISSSTVAGTALGHDYGEWITEEGNCTTDTVSTRYCKRCDHFEQDVTPAPGHQFDEWHVAKEPTCTLDGKYARTCSVCGLEESIPLTKLGHDYQMVNVKDPTCVDAGEIDCVCSRCGDIDESRNVYPAATGVHTWGNMIVNAPTCNSDGFSEQFCTVCGKLNEDTRQVVSKQPDAHVCDEKTWKVITPGNCISGEVQQNTCSVCGKTVTRVDDSKVTGAHAYKTVVVQPTFESAGKEERVCTVCGETTLVKVLARLPKFKDVDTKAWYAEYVAYVTANGLFKGYSDNTFKPNASITRAEVVTVIARMAGANLKNFSTTQFSDVPKSHWANSAVAWGAAKKIVSGRTSTTFAPNDNISREELCTILVRYAKSQNITLKTTTSKVKFADDQKISAYAKDNVYICQTAGIVSGRQNNMFAPKDGATRAEISKVLTCFIAAID